MDTPYPIDRMPNQLHYTYLDTFGRPVLVATKSNLVEQHIQDVVVSALSSCLSYCRGLDLESLLKASLFSLLDCGKSVLELVCL